MTVYKYLYMHMYMYIYQNLSIFMSIPGADISSYVYERE